MKDLSKKGILENFTTVVAESQLEGKGQMNTHWHSAKGKNLLFTVYVALTGLPIALSPYVSFLVALKIREVLDGFLADKTKIQIKWPNDIMSYNQKITGILVENKIKQEKVFGTFIGIGINVNQLVFPDFLPNATSMSIISGVNYNKDLLLTTIINEFKKVLTVGYILENKEIIKKDYLSYLYKINIPSMFRDKAGNVFMAKVINVSDEGLLIVEKQDELAYSYAVKEISFL
ncbi:BirA family biotin operon repressor/biotin-[acetyl-CoA-carboxylase] ligase [Wenyingzhuangia heitensis]|uniref:BirA family biotin operon repressor/biotin-[acetyl-CoA-carboxylase] ligase n=1 Tax=Wenyingzhuangia heitensis TaxID=1487859 RepID=A0ABX0UAZ9_9FLAO|nr:BirA family biotin operon repressor/biotin-[acetyl-CoA-carboxylase] ligase [Wenyingzhuangia heitensis]